MLIYSYDLNTITLSYYSSDSTCVDFYRVDRDANGKLHTTVQAVSEIANIQVEISKIVDKLKQENTNQKASFSFEDFSELLEI
jgi:hypothetical protein